MSKVSKKALAFNLALAKYPIPSQDDVFQMNKARTPGNYTYVLRCAIANKLGLPVEEHGAPNES